MDGLQDETKQVDEGTAQQTQDASAQVSGDAGAAADGGIAQARADYEAALKERDARIAELEGEIAEAAKTAEGAEALRKEMDELRRRGDEERVGFELQLAGARNVKAARALLSDYDNDVEKLRAAERGRRRDRRGHADEPLAQDCRPSRERGVADGKQHRVHQELHGSPGRGLQEGSVLDVPELAAPHGARDAMPGRLLSPRSR